MNERREPTITPLTAGAEEEGLKKPQASRAQARSAPPSSRRSSTNTRQSSGGGSALAAFAFIFALLACGASGLLFLQLMKAQKALEASSGLLTKADARIGSLEEKLALTGDESVQSMTALQSKIKTNASEIRKLWGVAYDTNRSAIAENKQSIAKNSESLSQLVKTYSAGDGKLKKSVSDLAADVSVLSELMNAQQGVLANVDKASQEYKEAIDGLGKKLGKLDGVLSKKVASNEEAIQAIDAFRLQVNRELIRLKGG